MSSQLSVDCTGWVIGQLALPGMRVVAEVPADLETRLPAVRVTRAGGGTDGTALDMPRFTFDCFAADLPAANMFAMQVRAAVRGLRGVAAAGGVCTHVGAIYGPYPVPWGNTLVRRVVLTAELTIRST